jgi:hypothetical protein
VALSFSSPLRAQDVLTYHNDNARTGQALNETILTPSNVNSTQFGKLFQITVDGKVDAQPLYASQVAIPSQGTHNVLYVATENDSVYAFDADTGAQLWQVSVLPAGETPSDDRGCTQVFPEIGITATPVIDRSSGPNGTIYIVAMTKDASGSYHQRLHALDITTGAEVFGGPTEVQATFPGTGENSNGTDVIFDPGQYKERPGLLLLNNLIYTSFSSHCDHSPYTAWVIAYDESTLNQVNVLDLTPNGAQGSVWMSGAGLAADSVGNIYPLLANGTFDTTLDQNGFPSQGDYGNAFVKLSTANGGLAVADYFTMTNTVAESDVDEDLGSGGALVLPDMVDANGVTRHLAVGAGKDQTLYLADRDNMGKFNPIADSIYQEIPSALPGGIFSMPAYFNGVLYYGPVGFNLLAFQFSNARLQTTPVSSTSTIFAYPGATPSVSANGTSNAIVWATENTNPAVLHAYNAVNLSNELYNSNQAGTRDQFGAGNKFITPTIANGKVYVGTTNGVGAFGLLSGAGPSVSLSTTTVSFGNQPVGTTSAPIPVTVTNNGTASLSFTSIAATGDFSVAASGTTCTISAPLATSSNCVIDVAFTPTAAGARSGSLTLADNASGSPQVVSLIGTGAGPSVSLSTSTVSFGNQPVGTTSAPIPVTVTNNGTASLSFTSVVATGDFSVAASGTTCTISAPLAASSNCVIDVAFTPTAAGARSGSLTLTDNASGSPQVVSLIGTGTAPAVSLSASPAFPPEPVGTTSPSQGVTVINAGNASLSFAAIRLSGPFGIEASRTSCTTSSSVSASGSCTLAITFTPTSGGPGSGSLSITDNAPNSPQTVQLAGIGEDFTLAPPSGSSSSSAVPPGQAATYTLIVGKEGGMTEAVAFTCTGAPSESTCTVSPNPTAPGANVTVTVATTAPSASPLRFRHVPTVPPGRPMSILLWTIAVLMVGIAGTVQGWKNTGASKRRAVFLMLATGLLLTLAVGACGGGGGGMHDPGTPVGTYTLTVTGTAGSGSSALSHNVTLTLKVT